MNAATVSSVVLTHPVPHAETPMNTALWIIAGLLATAYFAGGLVKVLVPKPRFAAFGASSKWVEPVSPAFVKTIGALEVLGAIGLILPALLGIAPVLVPMPAIGLALIMVGPTILRIRRHEYKVMAADLAYLALFVFVAVGRRAVEPF